MCIRAIILTWNAGNSEQVMNSILIVSGLEQFGIHLAGEITNCINKIDI